MKNNFESVLSQYLARRSFIKKLGLGAAAYTLAGCTDSSTSAPEEITSEAITRDTSLTFKALPHDLDGTLTVADDYLAQVLIRWGDPIFPNLGDFDPQALDAAEQLKRFGFNNDFIGFVPMPLGSNESDSGLLVVNHEYTIPPLMFPGSPKDSTLSIEQVATDIAAHGLSVIEIKKQDGGAWEVVLDSSYNRRITPETPMRITGPAAGSERLQSLVSSDGVHTLGTYGNCAGGVTPWGTILTGEENVDGYFYGDVDNVPEAENYQRFGHYQRKNWGVHRERWNLEKNPQEMLHVGWIVEIDPFDPESKPKKRTALGRFKHEGANVLINSDGRAVAYSGDDQRFEYIYKFVSKNRFIEGDREANMNLLEEGTLFVAKFEADGHLLWLPLVFGVNGLDAGNGFNSQADIALDTRKAADIVGATKMDRPEDVDINKVNGRVYAMLTNNTLRTAEQKDEANPRAHNSHGQVIEFWPADGDHSSERFTWDMFLLAGKPGKDKTQYHPDLGEHGWLSCPDNCAFDNKGNIWIATDGAEKSGIADGVWACEVDGPNRALTKRFLRTPMGAELCGPFFTPDNLNFFVSVQHPAGDSTFEKPDTRWPDFREDMPPRPAVVVITHKDGKVVGS